MGIKMVWLYANNIIKASRVLINEGLKALGLSSAEGNILLHLLAQGDKVQQKDIVAQLEVTKTAISKALNSLESKGYVKRVKDVRDKRASLVILTDKAERINGVIEKVYNEVFEIGAKNLKSDEIAGFVEIFEKVSGNFNNALNTRGGDQV